MQWLPTITIVLGVPRYGFVTLNRKVEANMFSHRDPKALRFPCISCTESTEYDALVIGSVVN